MPSSINEDAMIVEQQSEEVEPPRALAYVNPGKMSHTVDF